MNVGNYIILVCLIFFKLMVLATLKKTNFGTGHLFLLDSTYKQNIYLHLGLKLN